jgi:hypothetical protein
LLVYEFPKDEKLAEDEVQRLATPSKFGGFVSYAEASPMQRRHEQSVERDRAQRHIAPYELRTCNRHL